MRSIFEHFAQQIVTQEMFSCRNKYYIITLFRKFWFDTLWNNMMQFYVSHFAINSSPDRATMQCSHTYVRVPLTVFGVSL